MFWLSGLCNPNSRGIWVCGSERRHRKQGHSFLYGIWFGKHTNLLSDFQHY